MSGDIHDSSDKPVLALIQRLKDGSVSPSTLTREQRQECILTLRLEGYTIAQVAQLVDRNERTIRRDLVEIYQRHALNPSPELAKQLIGNFLLKVEAHQTRLMRLARGNEGTVGERAQAEFVAWKVLKESMEVLQSLGYLPLRPQQVVGDVVHHVSVEEGDRSLEEISQTIQEITAVGQETNTLTPEIAQRIQDLQLRLEKARLSQDAQRLLEQQKQSDQAKGSSNE